MCVIWHLSETYKNFEKYKNKIRKYQKMTILHHISAKSHIFWLVAITLVESMNSLGLILTGCQKEGLLTFSIIKIGGECTNVWSQIVCKSFQFRPSMINCQFFQFQKLSPSVWWLLLLIWSDTNKNIFKKLISPLAKDLIQI